MLAVALVCVAVGCDDPDAIPVRPSAQGTQLTLTAFPTTVLRSGSSVRLSARLADDAGTSIRGERITFQPSSGTVEPNSAITNENGSVIVTFTGEQDAHIVASTSGIAKAIDVNAVAPFTVSVRPSLPIRTTGADVEVVLTAAAIANPPIPTVTLDCGAGAGAVDVTATRRTRCTFPREADFTLTATAGTPNGWTTSDRMTVRATEPGTPPPPTGVLSVAASLVAGREYNIAVSASIPMRRFAFHFGDGAGENREPSGGATTASARHVYASQPLAPYVIRVEGEPLNGGTTIGATTTVTVP